MGLTFKQILAEDVKNTFTNSNEFGESLVYKPKDGTARTIAGVVDEEGTYPELANEKDSIEFLEVFVSRDSTTGINDPQLGDRISRVADGEDDDAKWYAWQGEKTDVDSSGWSLKFVRQYSVLKGGNRRQ